jgi:DNA uptake protein ComE-like DNA-binding protein
MKNTQFIHQIYVRFSDQPALFVLGFFVIALHIVWFTIPSWWPKQQANFYAVNLTEPITKAKTSVFKPFNPNFISDYKGYLLGMKPQELDRLTQFRDKGLYVQTGKEFQQITGISDALLAKLSPYFKFPIWKSRAKKTYFNPTKFDFKSTRTVALIDINQASSAELEAVRGIGPVLAQRIIQFRDQLGGFFELHQLMDVWGIKPEVYQETLHHFTIQKPSNAIRINLNQADVKSLRQFPYFNSFLAREIIKKRTQVENLTITDLTEINSFPVEKIKNIALYLEF